VEAEIRLVRAVIDRAFEVLAQAKGRQPNGRRMRILAAASQRREDRAQVIAETVAWFRRRDSGPWSLEWCCRALRGWGDKIDAGEQRDKAQDILEGE